MIDRLNKHYTAEMYNNLNKKLTKDIYWDLILKI